MELELSLQILVTTIAIILYFVVLSVIGSIVGKLGVSQKFIEKRILYIKKFFVFLLVAVLLVMLAFIWGIDVRGVMIFASSFFAVVGVALFASWSVLSNITSGIIIFFSFPYKIGDRIRVIDGDNSVTGEVCDMTLFHIQIKEDNGNNVYYPNNLAIQKPITKIKATSV